MNALRTVSGHDDVINVKDLRQIVRRLKNSKGCRHTPVYICYIDSKKNFNSVNHLILAKKLFRNMSLQVVKLFSFWYRTQEFMVLFGNSVSLTFRFSVFQLGSGKGDSCHHCCTM